MIVICRDVNFASLFLFDTMKKKSIVILVCLVTTLLGQAQSDTSVVKKKSAFSKNLGIGFGFSYASIGLESKPFVLNDSTGKLGYSQAENGFGANVSLFYNIPIGKNLVIRPGADAHFSGGAIVYDTEVNHKKRSEVLPVAVEIPIHLIWKFHYGNTQPDGFQPSINLNLGVRPVIAIKSFANAFPAMQSNNFNIEGGIGMPVKTKKKAFLVEVVYSHGLLNLIGTNQQDVYTTSVSDLRKSFAGLRLYFN